MTLDREVSMGYVTITTDTRGAVGLVALNRPEARNALNNQLVHELMDALEAFDRNQSIRAMVLTGSDKAFAAGADIKEMASQNTSSIRSSDFIQTLGRLSGIGKPLIAAVGGWALGGGCEVALACDMIVAADTARFGQPEITIGVIPGAGGTQRLPRMIGKPLAMEVILNNRVLTAQEALAFGMVNRVVPADRCVDEALALATELASRAPLAVRRAKRLINQAQETPLSKGLEDERASFFDLFSSEDRSEGMRAFTEKREPRWTGN
jgi:enoyl-CoA hydratase